jgi:hypothetical protein
MNPRLTLVTLASGPLRFGFVKLFLIAAAFILPLPALRATPANKSALERHYDRFLPKELNRCTTCHLPSEKKSPETLDEFPHNPFGHRLRLLGEELARAGASKDIPTRLGRVAREDTDADGVDNETELLLGHNPGDANDTPTAAEMSKAGDRRVEFAHFLASYRWQPFETVRPPPVPRVANRRWTRNPIDAFVAAERETRGLTPRIEASKEVLLRRVYLDLIGLSPTPAEQQAFLADQSAGAYEKVVDRLLKDPRYGERWGRHWMDVWRYSDWAGWTDGGQVRDSKPHIWRWRDWIVESLNADKPYDRMVMEMLAADELAPEDTNALRATGFLVRNYKMLSREQWLEDTVKHTAQAFLGLTLGCAKCHNHMVDPISQKEYYQVRAVFEPHQVRTDKIPGQTNTTLDGMVRVFDVGTNPPTWFFHRGDERHPDTNHVMAPGVLAALGGSLHIEPVDLPRCASAPDQRDFVIRDTIAAGEKTLADARQALEKAQTNTAPKPEKLKEQELQVELAERRFTALKAVLRAEMLNEMRTSRTGNVTIPASDHAQRQFRRNGIFVAGKAVDSTSARGIDDVAPTGLRRILGLDSTNMPLLTELASAQTNAAFEATSAQRQVAVSEAELKLHLARQAEKEAQNKADVAAVKTNGVEKASRELEAAKKKTEEAEKTLAAAEKELEAAPSTAYKPRPAESYPATSTGRRLAFARWIADANNPLTARVAMNHIWLRHFGRGIVPTPADFGRNGRPPSHAQLLDWLAGEFVAQGWSMKAMHRLMVTSSTYRMASTPDEANARLDPDNVYLWRMNSHRLEAEAVRDNLLDASGSLDLTMGGPDIDHKLGLTSKRRSIYLRLAAEKEVEFLKIFDGPTVTECYERKPSVVPQQALALANSELAIAQARILARELSAAIGDDPQRFISLAFRRVLARRPSHEETRLCIDFLSQQTERAGPQHESKVTPVSLTGDHKTSMDPAQRARENLVLVLMNHNDFVTVR